MIGGSSGVTAEVSVVAETVVARKRLTTDVDTTDLAVQLVGYLGDFAALVTGALQLIGGRLARTICTGDGGRAIG